MDKQEQKLKDCPNCECGDMEEVLPCGVGCRNCGSIARSKKLWNSRPEEDRLNTRIKELEEGLQHIINHVEMSMQGGVKAFSMHSHWRIATKALNKGN